VRIQRIPLGLLSLLDSKSTLGKTPVDLSEIVAGVLNLEPYYLANALTAINVPANVQNSGDVCSTNVPEGEAWRLVGLSALASFTAAATLHLSLAIRPVSAGFEVPVLRIGPEAVATATAIVHQGILLPEPLVLAPGSQILARVNTDSASAYLVQMRPLFHRLVA